MIAVHSSITRRNIWLQNKAKLGNKLVKQYQMRKNSKKKLKKKSHNIQEIFEFWLQNGASFGNNQLLQGAKVANQHKNKMARKFKDLQGFFRNKGWVMIVWKYLLFIAAWVALLTPTLKWVLVWSIAMAISSLSIWAVKLLTLFKSELHMFTNDQNLPKPFKYFTHI